MINQRHKDLTYIDTLRDFVKGAIDFKGYTIRKGYWLPLVTISFIFALYYCIIPVKFTLDNSLKSKIILRIPAIIVFVPSIALITRRLRDAGLAEYSIPPLVIVYSAYYIYNIVAKPSEPSLLLVLATLFNMLIFVFTILPSDKLSAIDKK